jgi:hypothetical protein
MNADHGQHKVRRHGLAVLVGDFRVPGHFAPSLVGAQALARAGESDLDSIAGFYRLHEAQLVEAIIAKHRTVVRIDEQPGRRRYQKVPVRDPAAEQRIARRLCVAHVRVEIVPGEGSELLDVGHRHLAFGRFQRVAQPEFVEGNAEGMASRIELPAAPYPAPADGRDGVG